MSPVPLGSSFPLIYSAKHEIQYGCRPGHGRRRPNGSLAEEFAVWTAEMGECVTWNGSKQMSHIGYGLDSEYSGMERTDQMNTGGSERKPTR